MSILWEDPFSYASEAAFLAAYDTVVDTGSGSDNLTLTTTDGRTGGAAKFEGTNNSILSSFRKTLPVVAEDMGVTGEADTDIITADLGVENGDSVKVVSLPPGEGTGLVVGNSYWVTNASGGGFQLSVTEGGAAATFGTDITAGHFQHIGYQELMLKVASKMPGINGGQVGGTLCTFMFEDIEQVTVAVSTYGAVEIYRNTTLLGETDDWVIRDHGWHFYEIYAKFDDSTGRVDVRVDNTETTTISLTGQDTNGFLAKKRCNQVRIGWSSLGDHKAAQPGQLFDDLKIRDVEGGPSWEGDDDEAQVRVVQMSLRVVSSRTAGTQPKIMVIQ